jgi:hypothetical protein
MSENLKKKRRRNGRPFEEAREYVRGPHAHVWVQASVSNGGKSQ